MHRSVLFEITWDKTLASARTQARPRGHGASTRTWCVHADAVLHLRKHGRPHGRTSLPSPLPPSPAVPASARTLNNFQFSIFGFQSPKSPKPPTSPSSAGFAGEAARRRRFFRPSSPSHPSKLYSSLGWLNSKVPKPFPPFSLRLIDVDGF
jgi:hypothetical protein